MNPSDHDMPIQQVLVEMTDGGLDFTFEAVGSVLTMVRTVSIPLHSRHFLISYLYSKYHVFLSIIVGRSDFNYNLRLRHPTCLCNFFLCFFVCFTVICVRFFMINK